MPLFVRYEPAGTRTVPETVVLEIWSALAPLQSAAIAHGVLAVDSQRKTIQHLEGGIIREIL